MTNLEYLAKDLQMKPEVILKESLPIFLKHKLKVIESELFVLFKKYGVETVLDIDRLISEGKLHENDTFEDYFTFDNLEADRDLIIKHLEKL